MPRGRSDRGINFDYLPPHSAEVKSARGHDSTPCLRAVELLLSVGAIFTFTWLYDLFDVNTVYCMKRIQCVLWEVDNKPELACLLCDPACCVQRCRHKNSDSATPKGK
jgi:hypothetical protein